MHHRRLTAPTRVLLGAAIAIGAFTTAPIVHAQATAVAVPSVDRTTKVSAGVYEIVVSGANNAVYVATAGSRSEPGGQILELDAVTLDVRRTIDVSESPAYGLGINDRTQTLYTSNTRNGSVSAIDLRSGRELATISVADNPNAHTFRVLVDEPSNTVYVSVAQGEGQVWVIDGATNTLAHIIEGVGTRSTGMAIDPNTNRLFVASLGSNEIVAVDLASREVVARMASGGERPTQLAFDPATSRLFVTNQGTGTMTVLDTRSGELLASVETGDGALGIGFNASTDRVYVANRQTSTVTVVDATSYEEVADLASGTLPNTIAIDARTNVAYVTNKARSGPNGEPDPNGDTVTRITP